MRNSCIKVLSALALSVALMAAGATCALADETTGGTDAGGQGTEVVTPDPEPQPEVKPDPMFKEVSVKRYANRTGITMYKGSTFAYRVIKETTEVSTNPAVSKRTRVTTREINTTSVRYSTSNSKIAAISSAGIITARGCGYTTVSVYHVKKKTTYTCKILVINPLNTKVAKQKGVPTYSAAKGNAIVKKALSWVGKGKYRAGACKKGYFDCSGFVSYVIAGKRIGNTYSFLSHTKVKNPQPGDICVRSAHAGIYIGNGMMIHAVGKGKGVKVGKVERGMKYVRIYKK